MAMFACNLLVTHLSVTLIVGMPGSCLYGKIASGSGFTNREDETKRLGDNILSKINTVLISPRRRGNSSLVASVAGRLSASSPSIRFCFIDLFIRRS